MDFELVGYLTDVTDEHRFFEPSVKIGVICEQHSHNGSFLFEFCSYIICPF